MISFGTIDVHTGEIKNGYIDESGKMAYKNQPWYKRFFKKRPEKIEYIKSVLIGGEIRASLYKKFNPFTNKIYELYAIGSGLKFQYDINAYLKDNIYVCIEYYRI